MDLLDVSFYHEQDGAIFMNCIWVIVVLCRIKQHRQGMSVSQQGQLESAVAIEFGYKINHTGNNHIEDHHCSYLLKS